VNGAMQTAVGLQLGGGGGAAHGTDFWSGLVHLWRPTAVLSGDR
jgi:hypothetical protein